MRSAAGKTSLIKDLELFMLNMVCNDLFIINAPCIPDLIYHAPYRAQPTSVFAEARAMNYAQFNGGAPNAHLSLFADSMSPCVGVPLPPLPRQLHGDGVGGDSTLVTPTAGEDDDASQ